jgi:hypothetical protein
MARTLWKMGMIGAVAGSLAIFGCGSMRSARNSQTWTMTTADNIPAATGKVQVANEKDGNTDVKVEVEHMAPAENVENTASTYVVWIKPENGAPQNVGVLQVDKNLKGELETKTPYKQFTVLVTAEPSPAVTAPHGRTMMDTRVTLPI